MDVSAAISIYGFGHYEYLLTRRVHFQLTVLVSFVLSVLAGIGSWLGFRVGGGRSRRVSGVVAAAGGGLVPGVLVLMGVVCSETGQTLGPLSGAVIIVMVSFGISCAAMRLLGKSVSPPGVPQGGLQGRESRLDS